MAADMGNQWEDLRKRARQLENEIDLKLVSFSKHGTSYSSQHNEFNNSKDTSPLLNKSSSEHMFDTMAMEIQQLLSHLTEVNNRMSDYTQNLGGGGPAPNAAVLHTLKRHRDILQDYSQEFNKTKTNIMTLREREDLLGSKQDSYKNSSGGLNRRSELYLKEHDHIRNSERMVDDQISIAIATKENLDSQKKSLGGISHKITNVAHRFPLLNSLMQRINVRKRRDAIILGSVIGLCLIFLLIYEFH